MLSQKRYHVRRWFLMAVLLVAVLPGAALTAISGAAAIPAGLSPADWQAIRGQLPPSVPVQEAYLKASNAQAQDIFGQSVAVSGDTVVVGAPEEDSGASGVNGTPNESLQDSGAAYVFVRSGATWTQQAYLKAANPGAEDRFGWSVAIDGDTIVVGAFGEDGGASGVNGTPNEAASAAGAAYVFVRSGATWTQQAYLKASNPGQGDSFGVSVAVSGDIIAVGAVGEDGRSAGVDPTPNEDATQAGAAYVFERAEAGWSQQAYLKAVSPAPHEAFGESVAVSGTTVVVGSPLRNEWTHQGAAYVFVRNEPQATPAWYYEATVTPSYHRSHIQFGKDVAISGDTLVVGAPYEYTAAPGGGAYVFVRSGGAWSQQAYLTAANSEDYDDFGWSVGVSGDTLIVGAFWEDSGAGGIDSMPNESATQAGAAYVFVRDGARWRQQRYLKAANPGPQDFFGAEVAISGETAVVGAYGEDSGASGINPAPNEAADSAGAAYVFAGIGPVPLTAPLHLPLVMRAPGAR